jgi:hypothetical protein
LVSRVCNHFRNGAQILDPVAIRRAQQAQVPPNRCFPQVPLDDCLYALRATVPHLTRSSLHRCLQRHAINRLPDMDGDKPKRSRFKTYPIGFFHIEIAEVRTERQTLSLGRNRPDVKIRPCPACRQSHTQTATAFLRPLIDAVPYKIHTILTGNGIQFCDLTNNRISPAANFMPAKWHRTSADQAQSSLDQWPGRTHEPPSRSDRQAILLRKP